MTALEVDDLVVELVRSAGDSFRIVDDVSFAVDEGSAHGIVGESGCGKSTMLRALLGLLPPELAITHGRIRFGDVEITPDRAEFDRVRGRVASMIFQDPSAALNPVLSIGSQLTDGPRRHHGMTRRAARRHALELLERVGVPDPSARMNAFPHQLSGGLRQRVMIAIALSSSPSVLLCDEPTTALDVTIQDQILGLLDSIRAEGVALVFVSHDLAVVDALCEHVAVMYAGRIVERGRSREIFRGALHPYTTGLLAAVPDVHGVAGLLRGIPGAPPDPAALPPGCAFSPRCERYHESCDRVPATVEVSDDHHVACWDVQRHEVRAT